jgi:polyhydroxyalkanoate synthesis repressor PhaR
MTKVTIKKYSDRRLYDTAARRYVNLDDIARMIREGADVEVRDARTGKDLTRAILAQIIMEDTREGGSGLPVQLLRQLVVTGTALRSRMSDATSAVLNPVEFVRSLLPSAAPEGERAEIEELRARVSELEARLARRERRRPARKTSA